LIRYPTFHHASILGPALSAQPRTSSTWQAFLDSRLPVRDLPPGQRPADWLELGGDITPGSSETADSETADSETADSETADSGTAKRREPTGAAPRLALQRYKIQFQAGQEYVDLLEKATDLLPYAARTRALEEVHLRAMRLLIAELEKRKYGQTKYPRAQGSSTNAEGKEPKRNQNEPESNEPESNEPEPAADTRAGEDIGVRAGSTPVAMVFQRATSESPRRRGVDADRGARADSGASGGNGSDKDERSPALEKTPRRRGRYIPVEARRTVRERDGGRCTYVAADGTRCRETSCLEVHHQDPYSRGGAPTSET
jgi:hypothetical protein